MATPTAWTSNNMTWTASGEGRPLMPYMDALRAAAAERHSQNINGGTGGWFADQIGNEAPITAWLHEWAVEIDRLIGDGIGSLDYKRGYINKNDNAGNWDGLATAPKFLNTDIMFSDILEENRIFPVNNTPLEWAWAYQQYSIIQELVWQRHSTTTFNGDGGSTDGFGQANGATDAAATAAADSAYATASPATLTPTIFERTWIKKNSGDFAAQTWHDSGRILCHNTATHARDVDFYFYVSKAAAGGTGTNTFSDYTNGYTEDTFAYVETKTISSGNVNSSYFGQTQPPSWPVAPTVVGDYETLGWKGTLPFSIVKHNVTSGFAFQ